MLGILDFNGVVTFSLLDGHLSSFFSGLRVSWLAVSQQPIHAVGFFNDWFAPHGQHVLLLVCILLMLYFFIRLDRKKDPPRSFSFTGHGSQIHKRKPPGQDLKSSIKIWRPSNDRSTDPRHPTAPTEKAQKKNQKTPETIPGELWCCLDDLEKHQQYQAQPTTPGPSWQKLRLPGEPAWLQKNGNRHALGARAGWWNQANCEGLCWRKSGMGRKKKMSTWNHGILFLDCVSLETN